MGHAVFTKDESIWKNFAGEVPRVGDIVSFIKDENEYRVEQVRWFIIDNFNPQLAVTNAVSEARVLIKPITAIR